MVYDFQEVQAASEGAEIPGGAPLSGRFRFEAFDGSWPAPCGQPRNIFHSNLS